jgi:hypothetical protein
MANKATSNGTVVNTLQRGKACLRCRKRKMRCDGVKPACQQCSRAKKADCCEYDDGKGKTRTQILRENIARLEQRVRELEDPGYTSPVITLHNPHLQYSGSSSSSVAGSPEGIPYSPFPSDSANSPQDCWTQLPLVGSPSPVPFADLYHFDEPQPPFELTQMLLDIFSPHRHQCGLEIDMGRLRENANLPASEQRHPVLMNAIFLWSCYVSRPGPLCQHENHYLTRALDALGDALRHADKVVDVVQASCLLSLYFLSNGRMLEGGYHASTAASLAVQFGLDRSILQPTFESMYSFKMEPARDPIEESERILAFWQAYNLDYCWSVVLRKPPIIREGRYAFNSVNWPRDAEEYDAAHIDGGLHSQTIRPFLETHAANVTSGYSTLALRAKASALFERADRLSSSWDQRIPPSSALREEIQALELAISRLQASLIPPHQLDTVPCDKHALIIIHTLTHAAMIHLYSRFAQDDPISYNKCLRSARASVAIIKHITDSDLVFLDPMIGPCWTCAADALIRELDSIEASWPLVNSADVRSEIGSILYAMTSLSARFPLLGCFAVRIQKRLTEL